MPTPNDETFLALLPEVLDRIGTKTRVGELLRSYSIRHKRAQINRFKIRRILLSGNVSSHDKETILMFLYSLGIEYDPIEEKFTGELQKTAFSPYAVDISEIIRGKYIVIYDLQHVVPDDEVRRYHCAYIEIKNNKNMPFGISGYYWSYAKTKEVLEEEKAYMNIELPQTNNDFIKFTPHEKDRFDRPNATFIFRIFQWTNRPILIGAGLGFNDDERDYIVAVRAICLPLVGILKERMPYIALNEEDKSSVKLFRSLDGILKGLNSLDVPGAMHVGPSRSFIDESGSKKRIKYIDALSWLWD